MVLDFSLVALAVCAPRTACWDRSDRIVRNLHACHLLKALRPLASGHLRLCTFIVRLLTLQQPISHGSAGLLGIGGGSIISPLLVELKVNPAVGGATASLMVVFSGSLSLLSYALSGSLNMVYGEIYGITAFVAAAVGATVIGHIVRRTGKVRDHPGFSAFRKQGLRVVLKDIPQADW